MAKRQMFPMMLAGAALAFHLFAGFSFISSAAPTFDEPVHLTAGYAWLSSGRSMMDLTGHPPLSQGLSALPLLASRLSSFAAHPYSVNGQMFHYADLFLYNNSLPAEKLLNRARSFTFLVWTALSAFFLYRFGRRAGGEAAGAFAVAVFCLMPAFISNNALVTTDAGAAVFLLGAVGAAYALARPTPQEEKRRTAAARYGLAALAGTLAGLAMSVKFSMFVAPPLVAALWLADARLNRVMKTGRAAAYGAVALLSAVAVVLLATGGRPGLYYAAFRTVFLDVGGGRSSFACGHYSVNGVWWYFPLAFLVKTPLAVLFLFAACCYASARKQYREWLWTLVPAALYFAAALTSKTQIGYRHILPVMPFVALGAGLGLQNLISGRRWPALAAAGLLALPWGLLLYRTHPHYLAYFSELAGGPRNGYRLMVDSSLDWGQDVKGLASYLAGRGNPPVIFSYFGTARPESYGVDYSPLGVYFSSQLTGTGVKVCDMKEVLLAVSATNLQGVYYPDKQTFAWLKSREPVFTAGYSLFLYDLTRDQEGLVKLAELLDREGRNDEAECLYGRASAAAKSAKS